MKNNKPSLYLIPTPLGNIDDITLRALKTLEFVDLLLCEDTRETSKLLNKYDIKNKLVSCHEFNEDKIKSKVIEYLNEGLNIGLVTDQGTPLISDPGYRIVDYITSHGYEVISLPGPTAFVPALTVSALPPQPFVFYGFLNSKSSKQKQELTKIKDNPYTIIFYEAPHRLVNTLLNIKEVFGDRKICLVKEISKKFEQTVRGTITEVINANFELKGEFVIVVSGADNNYDYSDMDVIEHVNLYLDDGISKNDAIKMVAKERNVPKSIIYKEYHQSEEGE